MAGAGVLRLTICVLGRYGRGTDFGAHGLDERDAHNVLFLLYRAAQGRNVGRPDSSALLGTAEPGNI